MHIHILRVIPICGTMGLTVNNFGDSVFSMSKVIQKSMDLLVERFDRYLRHERMRSPRTVARYVGVVSEFEDFVAGRFGGEVAAWAAVDASTLSVFIRRNMETAKPSRTSWNGRLAALRSFYEFLVRNEVVAMNPALEVERQKEHPREPVPLSLDEMLRLVEAIEWHAEPAYRARNVALVHVLYHCALRVAEVVSLDVSQVDFDNRLFLDVRRKGDRQLSAAFNDVVAESLEAYLIERRKIRVPAMEPALFLSDRRQRISVRTVQETVRRYGELAGLSRSISPHLLRHSSATQLVDLGTPLRVVQEICGHASIATTQRYVHVNGGQRRRAVDELGLEWRRHKRERRRIAGRAQPRDGPAPADSA